MLILRVSPYLVLSLAVKLVFRSFVIFHRSGGVPSFYITYIIASSLVICLSGVQEGYVRNFVGFFALISWILFLSISRWSVFDLPFWPCLPMEYSVVYYSFKYFSKFPARVIPHSLEHFPFVSFPLYLCRNWWRMYKSNKREYSITEHFKLTEQSVSSRVNIPQPTSILVYTGRP